MDPKRRPGDGAIGKLVASAVTRSTTDRRHLDTLLGRVHASGDRLEPGALPWLRRWGPHRLPAELPVCRCAVGGCALCG